MLQKANINVNFAKGVNTKPDPKQLQLGEFLSLQNTIFTKEGLLQKRNGFANLPALLASPNYIATLNGNLTSVSDTISAYSSSTEKWVNKGSYQSMGVSVLPLIRNNVNQTQADTAISPNGLVCTVYSELVNTTTTYKFAVANSVTGQNIVSPQAIPVPTGTVNGAPKVFTLGSWFVIVVVNLVSGTDFLQYIAINTNNIFDSSGALVYTTARVSSAAHTPFSTVGWDGFEATGRLFIAFNSLTGGQSIKVTYLTVPIVTAGTTGVPPTSFTSATDKSNYMTVTADTTSSNTLVYITFYDVTNSTGYTAAVNRNLAIVFAPVTTITGTSAVGLASVAQNGVCTIFWEVFNEYGYDSSILSEFVRRITIDMAGTVGTQIDSIRSVGLGSKAFIVNGKIYYLGAYQSPFQPTYFLIDGSDSTSASPRVVAKLAYENGAGYLSTGVPSVAVSGTEARVCYLYKDLIEPLNTIQNPQQTTEGGIYSQTGINLATFNFTAQINSAEIAQNLNLTGGFLWSYDGYLPVEQNFFLWPDSVEATWSATGGTIVAKPDGSTNTDAYYIAAVYEWSDNAGNIYRSAPSIPVPVTTSGSASTGSIAINIPTLRLTYKVPNPVKIVLYRWSVANETYYQITSITNPLLNDTTVDFVTFTDTLPDADIIGNSILYTTGGVLENVNPPATSIVTLFDTRLWLVDAEDPNLLWFSKQVIESTPVEMSDTLTFYIAPTIGSQGSTGPITALAPLDDKLVIFKENAIYYINGVGPDNTGINDQYSQPIFVTSTVGTLNPRSIVFMPTGLLFQSDKGIWLLDRGMNTTYIGAPVEDFTQTALVESSLNVPETNQVRFTMDSGVTLMYDYYFQQWGTFVGIPGLASCLFENLHTFVNAAGVVYQESPGLYVDGSEPVLISFTTAWASMAGLQGYQRAYFFYLLAQYLSPHKLQVGVSYDYNPSLTSAVLITPNNFSSAVPGPFGIPSPFPDVPHELSSPVAVEQWRVFFARQRCQAFRISIQELYDPSQGIPPGAGFTMSGLNLVYGAKKGFRPQANAVTVGFK